MKKLTIENFKSYKNRTAIIFSDITLNVGMNSVGKSTVTQSLLLMNQLNKLWLQFRSTSLTLNLNGFCDLDLGQYKDVVSDPEIGIKVSIDKTEFIFKESDNPFHVLCNISSKSFFPLFKNGFYYINAERIGPRNYQLLTDNPDELCGVHGEYTYEAIARNILAIVDDRRLYKEKSNVKTLPAQIEAWMSFIVPGMQFSANESRENRIASMRMRQVTMDMDLSSPYNFGFGVSYVLSIVVTCLMAKEGATVIIENPEAHMHPAGQSHLGQFLAQMMASGIKIIVETHSEHLINGVRLYGLKAGILAKHICINHFSLSENGTSVNRIDLSDDMNIKSWPKGFFDQEETDLLEMRRIRKHNENNSNMEK